MVRPPASQKPGCGFPIIRLVALLSLATGMLTAWATGNWSQSEMMLFQLLWDQFNVGDVLLADRGFCNWAVFARQRFGGNHRVGLGLLAIKPTPAPLIEPPGEVGGFHKSPSVIHFQRCRVSTIPCQIPTARVVELDNEADETLLGHFSNRLAFRMQSYRAEPSESVGKEFSVGSIVYWSHSPFPTRSQQKVK